MIDINLHENVVCAAVFIASSSFEHSCHRMCVVRSNIKTKCSVPLVDAVFNVNSQISHGIRINHTCTH